MNQQSFSKAMGLAAAAALTMTIAPSFVPTATGPRTATLAAHHQASAPATGPAAAGLAAAGAATAATAVAVAIGLRQRRGAGSRGRAVAVRSRRELAVAYEESGVELYDNGKFAQGLLGADGAWSRFEFDPLGISKEWHEYVPWFREAELKHGRIAMLAYVGLVVPDFIRIPGERYSFEACPNTIVDGHMNLNGAVGVNVQIIFWISIVELCCSKKVFEWNSLETAGDYGLTSLLPKDEEGQKQMRLKELKNGRLAMLAVGGALTQAIITHHPFPWVY